MREIKFRVWEKDLKEMIPVNNINFESKMINTNSAWRMFNEIELMQFTGLHDKNGKEIYERDIIKIDDDWENVGFASGEKGYVIYVEGSYKLKKGRIYVPQYRLDSAFGKFTTVIGNIYEHPELLGDN